MALKDVLQIQYRGRLSSCNYTCRYCQFAKHKNNRAQLDEDYADLQRFVQWVAAYQQPIAVLFTPWGEALTRRYYQQALCELSQLSHLQKVAIQTNLSAPLNWLGQANGQRLALWATYHPSQTSRRGFLKQCAQLQQYGIRFSVGMVGNRADLTEAEIMRAQLPAEVYLWINANRAEQADYSTQDLARWQAIDPLFSLNLPTYASFGQHCHAGTRSISVLGDGTVQRCHFVKQPPLGNLYSGYTPQTAVCPNAVCDCHIGYIHLASLQLARVFGEGILERIPVKVPDALNAV